MTVHLDISSNASSFVHNAKFSPDISIGKLKERLDMITGCDSTRMTLELFDNNNVSICKPEDDSKTLSDYGFISGYRLHVIDPRMKAGELDSIMQSDETTAMYTLSEEAYANRKDSVLQFKKANKFGQFKEISDEERRKIEEEREAEISATKAKADSLIVGERCEIRLANQPTRRGFIRFIGETKFKEGLWVGVEYDEPSGKNDGSVDGVRYFQAKPKYGGFVKPTAVEMGDFPELELDDSDEI